MESSRKGNENSQSAIKTEETRAVAGGDGSNSENKGEDMNSQGTSVVMGTRVIESQVGKTTGEITAAQTTVKEESATSIGTPAHNVHPLNKRDGNNNASNNEKRASSSSENAVTKAMAKSGNNRYYRVYCPLHNKKRTVFPPVVGKETLSDLSQFLSDQTAIRTKTTDNSTNNDTPTQQQRLRANIANSKKCLSPSIPNVVGRSEMTNKKDSQVKKYSRPIKGKNAKNTVNSHTREGGAISGDRIDKTKKSKAFVDSSKNNEKGTPRSGKGKKDEGNGYAHNNMVNSPDKNNDNSRYNEHTNGADEDMMHGISRRATFASQTLLELQDVTQQCFEQQQQQQQQESGGGQNQLTTRLFALEYNEWSVAAISQWIGCPNRTGVPVVNSRYRKCNICSYYGHYEIECPYMNKDHAVEIGRLLSRQQKQQSRINNENSDKKDRRSRKIFASKKNDVIDTENFVDNHDVTAELCYGFMIEQRSEPEKECNIAGAAEILLEKAMKEEKEKNKVNEVEKVKKESEIDDLDGFCIEAKTSVDAFYPGQRRKSKRRKLFRSTTTPPPKPPVLPQPEKPTNSPVSVGDIVSWHFGARKDVAVGTIIAFDKQRDSALIRTIQLLPAQVQGKKCVTKTNNVNEQVWVPVNKIFLVDQTLELVRQEQAPTNGKKRKAGR